jgi:hypothetical protein
MASQECAHPTPEIMGSYEPPGKLDAICRQCGGVWDHESMPPDLLYRLTAWLNGVPESEGTPMIAKVREGFSERYET